tara:strand:+ start:561 stop:689 length:129 start_codon:yes stop_codon:yes gene_type:complete
MSKPDDKMKRSKPYRNDEFDKEVDRNKTRDKRKSRERKRETQ